MSAMSRFDVRAIPAKLDQIYCHSNSIPPQSRAENKFQVCCVHIDSLRSKGPRRKIIKASEKYDHGNTGHSWHNTDPPVKRLTLKRGTIAPCSQSVTIIPTHPPIEHSTQGGN